MAEHPKKSRTLTRIGQAVLSALPATLFYVGLLVVWDIASRAGKVERYILPGPSMIGRSIKKNWDLLLHNSWVTGRALVLGFLLGSLIGFVCALGIYYSKILRKILYPAAVFLQTVPKVALAPVFIIWFGTGQKSIIAITALICLFPVLVNTLVGFEGVDQNLLEMMHSVSASSPQRFYYILVPYALPSIVAGLEVGSSLAAVGAIVGEFIAAREGLGFEIQMASSRIATEEVFAVLLAVSILGMAFYYFVRLIGRLLLGNRQTAEGAQASA
ncbi:MAG: ABC transporter permease [Bifidobacteriaceae bacterium]|jgi:NitT/TauT family transport system permease protein|nr:ABC transporter permease [Bifidobacteriaceae bacterium]